MIPAVLILSGVELMHMIRKGQRSFQFAGKRGSVTSLRVDYLMQLALMQRVRVVDRVIRDNRAAVAMLVQAS